MPIETTSPRTGAMVFWIALLVLAALALGAGTFVFARRSVERAATAVLFFNPDAAYVDDVSLTHTDRPAVAAAQSILNDAVVLDVLLRAGDSSRDTAAATAEFRSGIEFAEPTLETLQLRFRDPDPRRASIVANAVATALEEWAPPVPTPAASKPAAETPPVTPAVRPDSLAAAYSTLAELEGRLAGLDERLGVLAGQPASADQPLYSAPLTAAQADRRRRLEAQLAETLREQDDLRARSAGDESDTETTERRIAELKHELSAFPLPSSASSQGSATIGTASTIARLRVQRRGLVNEIAAEMRRTVRLRAHPAAVTTAEQPKPSPRPPVRAAPAAAGIAQWQNPFRIARHAGLAPRILAQPARVAIGVSALFLAAAAFGIFLNWRLATRTEHTADAGWGRGAFVRFPPMSDAEMAATRQPIAVEPDARQDLVATERKVEREPIASEPEAEWETGAREPEGEWEPLASELDAEWEPVAKAPEAAQELIASEPEAEREPAASEPEAEWEPVPREPEAVSEPFARERVQSAGKEIDSPANSAPQISQKSEVAAPPEPSQPVGPEEPPETVPGAPGELVHRDVDTTKMPEAGRPSAQTETAPTPAAATSTQADEPPTLKTDGIEDGRKSFVDPGRGDEEWSARILQALERTSIGHWPEAEHRGETSNRTANNSPDKPYDAADSQVPERPSTRESGRK